MEGTAILRAPCKNYFQSRFKLFGFSSRKSAETAAGWPGCSFSWEGARPRLSFLSSHKYYSKLPLSDRSFAERVACWARFGHRFTLLLPWITSLLGRDDAPPRPKAETAPMAIWGGKRCERKVNNNGKKIFSRLRFHGWLQKWWFCNATRGVVIAMGKRALIGGFGGWRDIEIPINKRLFIFSLRINRLETTPFEGETTLLILFRTIEKILSLRFFEIISY